jgi:CRP/FNR family cyclic AMP-dependent transcriptional regulator
MRALDVLLMSEDFSDAHRETLESLTAGMERRRYPPRSVVFTEGEPSGPAYLIESGSVRLTSSTREGNLGFIADMGPGTLVGEMTALLGTERMATATAVSDSALWRVQATALHEALSADPRLSYKMMLSSMRLVLNKDNWILARSYETTLQRVASLLADLADQAPSAEDCVVSVTHEELALMTGLTRETVTRALATLRKGRVIETRRRCIHVLDLDSLYRSAGRSPPEQAM